MTAPVTHRATHAVRYDLAMLLVCVIWGGNFTASKLAFSELPPLAFTAIRFALGSVLLAVVVRMLEGPTRVPRGPLLWRLVWLGIFGNTLYQFGYVLGLSRSTATNTSLIVASSPAIVAILGASLGLERTSLRGMIGIALGIAGVSMVVLAKRGATLHMAVGDLLTVGAVFCWAIYTLGLRRLEGMTPLQVTAWTTYAGTPGLVLAAIPQLRSVHWSAVHWQAWGGLGYSIGLSLIVGYALWNHALREVGATRTTIYMCVTPLFAVLIAWAAMGERPTVLHAVGGVVIATGVVLTRLR